jgi:hypothetical protein
MSYLLQDLPLSFFVLRVAQVKKAKDFFTNELHTRAVEVEEAKEVDESARAGLSPQKGDVRTKRKENKKTKEGGLSPQEGDVRKQEKEKKRKRPRKARRWLLQRQGSVCPTPRIPFLVQEYLGLEAARLG